MDTEMYTQKRLARILACSEKKLEADRRRGSGNPYVKIGSLVRYRSSDVEEYLVSLVRHSTSEVRR